MGGEECLERLVVRKETLCEVIMKVIVPGNLLDKCHDGSCAAAFLVRLGYT